MDEQKSRFQSSGRYKYNSQDDDFPRDSNSYKFNERHSGKSGRDFHKPNFQPKHWRGGFHGNRRGRTSFDDRYDRKRPFYKKDGQSRQFPKKWKRRNDDGKTPWQKEDSPVQTRVHALPLFRLEEPATPLFDFSSEEEKSKLESRIYGSQPKNSDYQPKNSDDQPAKEGDSEEVHDIYYLDEEETEEDQLKALNREKLELEDPPQRLTFLGDSRHVFTEQSVRVLMKLILEYNPFTDSNWKSVQRIYSWWAYNYMSTGQYPDEDLLISQVNHVLAEYENYKKMLEHGEVDTLPMNYTRLTLGYIEKVYDLKQTEPAENLETARNQEALRSSPKLTNFFSKSRANKQPSLSLSPSPPYRETPSAPLHNPISQPDYRKGSAKSMLMMMKRQRQSRSEDERKTRKASPGQSAEFQGEASRISDSEEYSQGSVGYTREKSLEIPFDERPEPVIKEESMSPEIKQESDSETFSDSSVDKSPEPKREELYDLVKQLMGDLHHTLTRTQRDSAAAQRHWSRSSQEASRCIQQLVEEFGQQTRAKDMQIQEMVRQAFESNQRVLALCEGVVKRMEPRGSI